MRHPTESTSGGFFRECFKEWLEFFFRQEKAMDIFSVLGPEAEGMTQATNQWSFLFPCGRGPRRAHLSTGTRTEFLTNTLLF